MGIFDYITNFKYEGYILALQMILNILRLFANEIVMFIKSAVEAGKAIVDAMENAGESAEEIKAKKEELRLAVINNTKEKFSASPSFIRTAFIDQVTGLVVQLLDAKSEKQKANYEKMQGNYPVTSATIQDIKNSMPEEVRKLFFPMD